MNNIYSIQCQSIILFYEEKERQQLKRIYPNNSSQVSYLSLLVFSL